MTIRSRISRMVPVARGSKLHDLIVEASTFAPIGIKNVDPCRVIRKSYSQFGEDIMLVNLLFGRTGGYVDVGSGRPKRGSNTYALYRLGWSGVTIEPIHRHYMSAKLARPRDRHINAICGADDAPRVLWEFRQWEFTTTDAERAQSLLLQGFPLAAKRLLPSVQLRSLNLHWSPTEPTLLCVDVEGHEMEVLRGADFEQFRPGVICIEEFENPFLQRSQVRDFLQNVGYVPACRIGLSTIYIHEESGLMQSQLPSAVWHLSLYSNVLSARSKATAVLGPNSSAPWLLSIRRSSAHMLTRSSLVRG